MFRPGVARPLKLAGVSVALSGSLFAPAWLLATRPDGSGPTVPTVASASSLTVVRAPAPRPRPAVSRRPPTPEPFARTPAPRSVFVATAPSLPFASSSSKPAPASRQRPVKAAVAKRPAPAAKPKTSRPKAPKPPPKPKPKPRTTPAPPTTSAPPAVIESTDQVAQTPSSGQSSEPSARRLVAESPGGQAGTVSAADSKPEHARPEGKKLPDKPTLTAPPSTGDQGISAAPSDAVP